MLDQQKFLNSLKPLRQEYDIREIPQQTVTSKMKKRIAILVTDEFILANSNIHQAFFFESCLYFHLKKESFNCNELPIESQEYEKKVKARKGFNPLKLVSQNYTWEEDSPCLKALVEQVIIELKKKEVKTNGLRRPYPRKRLTRSSAYKQKYTQKPKTKRATLL